MAAKLTTRIVDSNALDASRDDWTSACGEDTFAVEYSGLFEYMALVNAGSKHGQYYAITEGRSSVAVAFVDIVSSPGGEKTKLLKLIVHPKFWHNKDLAVLRSIYIAAINATFAISNQNKTKVVKFYGRTADMLDLLVEIQSIWEASGLPDGLKSRMAGRWLEIFRR